MIKDDDQINGTFIDTIKVHFIRQVNEQAVISRHEILTFDFQKIGLL